MTSLELLLFNMKAAQEGGYDIDLKQTINQVTSVVKERLGDEAIAQLASLNKSSFYDLNRRLADENFLGLIDIELPCTKGQVATFVETLVSLKTALGLIDVVSKGINDLKSYLYQCIDEPEVTLRLYNEKFDVEPFQSAIGKVHAVIDLNKSNVQMPYGKLLQKNSQWTQIGTLCDELADLATDDKLKQLESLQADISSSMNTLKERLSEAKISPNPKAMANLATYIDNLSFATRTVGYAVVKAESTRVACKDAAESMYAMLER